MKAVSPQNLPEVRTGHTPSTVGTALRAVAVAAGPWLGVVIALSVVSVLTEWRLGKDVLTEFRIVIIYGFAISLIATAPIILVGIQMAGHALYGRDLVQLKRLFIATHLAAVALTVLVSVIIFVGVFRLSAAESVACAVLCGVIAGIWVGSAFAAVLRDHVAIGVAFSIGLSVSVILAVYAATASGKPAWMTIGFGAGLALTDVIVTLLTMAVLPKADVDVRHALSELSSATRRYAALAISAAIATLGLWLDKFIMWGGAFSQTTSIGLPHAPLYDSAMFGASLTAILALSLFVHALDGPIFDSYQRFLATLRRHGTRADLERCARKVEDDIHSTLLNIMLVQFTFAFVVMMAAPLVFEFTGAHFLQIGIFRLGVLGVMFQFLLFAATALLVFIERHIEALGLHVLFATLNGVLAYNSMGWDPQYVGLSYVIASVVSALTAYAVLERSLGELTRWTFALAIRPSLPAPAPP